MNVLLKKARKKAVSVAKDPKVITAVIILIVALFFRKKIQAAVANVRAKGFDRKEGSDLNNIVQQYRAAVNPSGVSWLIDMDGTDEDTILALAEKTKGRFQEIARAYRAKFNESITDRMRSDLSVANFTKWQNIAA